MKKVFINNLFKKICILVFIIYIAVVFISQQQTLASYSSQKDYYLEKILEAEKYNQTLIATKDNLESKEYIETICREKLDIFVLTHGPF